MGDLDFQNHSMISTQVKNSDSLQISHASQTIVLALYAKQHEP